MHLPVVVVAVVVVALYPRMIAFGVVAKVIIGLLIHMIRHNINTVTEKNLSIQI